MLNFEFAVAVTRMGETHLATCRDFPVLRAVGASEHEALAKAATQLEHLFCETLQRSRSAPVPSAAMPSERVLMPSTEAMVKAALHAAINKAGVTNVELARRLNVDEKSVRRLLDPACHTKIPKVIDAIEALGRKLVVRMELA